MKFYRRVITKNPSANLTPKKGRPTDRGLNPSDAVSSFIEKTRRELIADGCKNNSLQRAKDLVKEVFVDISGLADPDRTIDRDWKHGKAQAQALSSYDLEQILRPNELK
jgi:hypothetical protein